MTPQDIINLISSKNGIQRKNKFSVTFFADCSTFGIDINARILPAIYMNFGQKGMELTPDRLTGPGLGRNIPTNVTYESSSGLLIRFPIEQDWYNYKLIQNWLNALSGTGTVTAAQYYDSCAKTGKVFITAETYNGNPACKFEFFEAFPVNILPLEFNSEPDAGNATFDVIFNFRRYTITTN
jgi:hypothetical protein